MNAQETKKRRKWPWILALGLAALVLACVVVLPRLLDPARFRPLIEKSLEQSTGWNVEVGEVGYSLLGGMVLTVSPLGLEDPEGESALDVARVEVRANPWALLQKRLDVQQVRLVEPRYRMVRAGPGDPWPLPLGASPEASAPGPAATESSTGIEIRIESIGISRGELSIEDRSVSPPLSLALKDVEAEMRPQAQELSLDAVLSTSGGSGRLHGGGRIEESLRFTLEEMTTEALQPLVGPDLLHAGGTVSGALEWKPPLSIHADLTAKNLALLAGEVPLESAQLAFEIRGEGERLTLSDLTLVTAKTRLSGSGPLSPDLDLTLEMLESPIESVLLVARAVFPFPLDFESPGTGQATIRITALAGEELRYSAKGELAAAGFALADYLPRAEHLRAGFTLAPSGALTVVILEGDVAGGPITGVATLDQVHPPGRLTFEGGLARVPLGALLAGFVGDSARAVEGPSSLVANLSVDLGREEIDLAALAGRIRLSSEAVALPGWDLEQAVARGVEEKLGKLSDLARIVGGDAEKRLNELAGRAAERAESPAKQAEEVLKQLGAEVDFSSSPWKLPEVQLVGKDFQAGGLGTFDAGSGAVDLALTVRFDAARTAEWVSRYPALKNLVRGESLTLPMKISGAMTSPGVSVDLGNIAAGALGLEAQPKKGVKGLLEGLIKKELEKKKGQRD